MYCGTEGVYILGPYLRFGEIPMIWRSGFIETLIKQLTLCLISVSSTPLSGVGMG